METLHQLCDKRHDEINQLLTAQATQIRELQNQVAKHQDYRKANQQPLLEVTDTLVELTRKISYIWDMSKGTMFEGSKSGFVRIAEDTPSLQMAGFSAPNPAVTPGLKAPTTITTQNGTLAVGFEPKTSTTAQLQDGTPAVLVKPSTSTTASSHTGAAVALTIISTPTTIATKSGTAAVVSISNATNRTTPASSLQLSTTAKPKTDTDGAPSDLSFATMPSSIKWALSKPDFRCPPPISEPKVDHTVDSASMGSKNFFRHGTKRKREEADEKDGDGKGRKIVKEKWQFRGHDKSTYGDSDS